MPRHRSQTTKEACHIYTDGDQDAASAVRATLRRRKAAIIAGTTGSAVDDRDAIDAMFRSDPDPDVAVEARMVGGVPAYWLAAGADDPSRVVLYLHGGSYAAGGLATHRDITGRLSRAGSCRVLLLLYRLAPEHPFPAPVEDALAAYRALLLSGVDPARLVLAGDSAGGGLALALLMALRDAREPLPAGAVVMSPWTDLASTAPSLRTKADIDPWLVAESVPREAAVYLAGADPRDPLASPLYGDLSGLPPLLVHVGEDEILLDDAVRVAEEARRAGVLTTLKVWPGMWHVFQLFAGQIADARIALDEIGRFIKAMTPDVRP